MAGSAIPSPSPVDTRLVHDRSRTSEVIRSTRQTRALGRLMLAPAVVLLFIWMIVPLAMTIYFSTLNYNLLNPGMENFAGLDNYYYFLTDPSFIASLQNTLVLVGSVLAITIVLGILIALLLDQAVVGLNIVR